MKMKSLFLILLSTCLFVKAEVQQSLRNYISSECNTLIGIDMKAVFENPVLNALMQSSQSDEMKQMKELGLTPQDVESVIIGLNSEAIASDPMAFEKQPELISISKVKEGITLAKLLEAAKANKVESKEEMIDGVKSIIMKKDGKEFVMAELADKVIAIGSKGMVKKAIALKASPSESISKNGDLTKLATDQKGLFWVVGAAPKGNAKDPNAPLDNPMASMFGDLKMFTLSVGFGEKGVLLNSDLICNNSEGADKLAMTCQLLTGFLAANENSPVKPEQIKFSKNESTVNVKVSLDPASLIKAASAAKGLAE